MIQPLAFFIFFFMFFWNGCASLESMGEFFDGNKRRDFRDYGIEERRSYHHYRDYQRSLKKEKEKKEMEDLKKI